MNYGNRLSQALQHANKSRANLAAALEVSVQAVGQVITGGRNGEQTFNAANNVKAAKFLGVDPTWLATGEGEMISAGVWPFQRLSNEDIGQLTPEHRAVVENLALNLLAAQPQSSKSNPARLSRLANFIHANRQGKLYAV